MVLQAWAEDISLIDIDIYPESETNFFLKINDEQLTFIQERQGRSDGCRSPYAGRNILNEPYWADFVSQTTGIRFDPGRDVFVQDSEDQRERVFERASLYHVIEAILRQRQSSAGIPAQELRAERIESVVESMKIWCVISQPTETEAFMEFAQTRLERRAGAALAKAEAARACREFFQTRGFRSYAQMAEIALQIDGRDQQAVWNRREP